MKIFELYFNPKNENRLCESFYHNPKDVYKRRVGRIYMVGEISDPKASESSLLSNIFNAVKSKYYEKPSLAPDKALKESLKEANTIIEEANCKGRIGIVFVSSKNFSVHFGKIGGVKIFLMSNEKVIDIGKELEFTGSKVFRNIVSGKMKKGDKIAVVTSEINHSFSREKVLEDLAKSVINEKVLDKISSVQKEKFPNTTGVSLLIDYQINIKEQSETTSEEKNDFSLKKIFLPVVSSLTSKNKKTKKEKQPKQKIKKPELPPLNKQKLLLPVSLIILLILGIVAVRVEDKIRAGRQLEELSEIEILITQGEIALKDGSAKKALDIFENTLEEISLISGRKTRIKEEIEVVEQRIFTNLQQISDVKDVSDLTPFAEITEMDTDQIVLNGEKIYLFSNNSENMAIVSDNGDYEIRQLPVNDGVQLSSSTNEGIVLYSTPDNIINLLNENILVTLINLPQQNTSFTELSSFAGKVYLLEKEGDIVLYTDKDPLPWIQYGEKNHNNAKAMAIDGSIFIIDEQNHLHRYYTGIYEERIDFIVYPRVSQLDKLKTSFEIPLFISEPCQKRIIVIDKQEGLAKQIYSENFDDIRDFVVSSDGKKIYLLNGQEVYLIEL